VAVLNYIESNSKCAVYCCRKNRKTEFRRLKNFMPSNCKVQKNAAFTLPKSYEIAVLNERMLLKTLTACQLQIRKLIVPKALKINLRGNSSNCRGALAQNQRALLHASKNKKKTFRKPNMPTKTLGTLIIKILVPCRCTLDIGERTSIVRRLFRNRIHATLRIRNYLIRTYILPKNVWFLCARCLLHLCYRWYL
jgi:hypothetical protein